jgi:pimeloyl-ACP methyl ester carboxylesterase
MKKKMVRKALTWLAAGILIIVTGLFLMAHFVEFRNNDSDLKNEFGLRSIQHEIKRYKVAQRTIRYIELGKDSLPVTILVHGAPSSLSFFKMLYTDTTLLNHTRLIGVDRPGYGYSDFGKSVISISDQAKLLQPLLNRYTKDGRKVIMAASSYGGSVVAKLAMDNPDKIAGILFVSSSLAPGEEHIYPISYFIDSRWFGWLFPTLLRVANDEKLNHEQALNEIQEGWSRIKSTVILLHGKADGLIYFSNALYAKKKLVNAKSVKLIGLDGIGHSIFWDKPEMVTNSLLELSQATRSSVGY